MENNVPVQAQNLNRSLCPSCKNPIMGNEFFCPNCGKKFRDPPPSTSIGKQISLYLFSILVPPFGVIPAIKYLKSDDGKTRTVGIVALVLTLASFLLVAYVTNNLIMTLNDTVELQMSEYRDLGL